MGKTYIHIQKAKHGLAYIEFNDYLELNNEYYEKLDQIYDSFGLYSKYLRHCHRSGETDWLFTTRIKKRNKIANKDMQSQLNDYYGIEEKNLNKFRDKSLKVFQLKKKYGIPSSYSYFTFSKKFSTFKGALRAGKSSIKNNRYFEFEILENNKIIYKENKNGRN